MEGSLVHRWQVVIFPGQEIKRPPSIYPEDAVNSKDAKGVGSSLGVVHDFKC